MDPNYLPTSEYARAMQTLRAGKSVFWWLILLSILVQIAVFVAVVFVGVLDASGEPEPVVTATAPADAVGTALDTVAQAVGEAGQAVARVIDPDAPTGLPASVPDETVQPASEQSTTWQFAVRWALAVTKFLAFVSGLILAVVVLYHLQVSLVGRLGGAAGFARAIMWSLVLLALLTPWQQVFDNSLVVGALYNLTDLRAQTNMVRTEWGAPEPTLWLQIVYYTRFLAYPIVTILVALMVHWRLRQAYSTMVLPVE